MYKESFKKHIVSSTLCISVAHVRIRVMLQVACLHIILNILLSCGIICISGFRCTTYILQLALVTTSPSLHYNMLWLTSQSSLPHRVTESLRCCLVLLSIIHCSYVALFHSSSSLSTSSPHNTLSSAVCFSKSLLALSFLLPLPKCPVIYKCSQ